MKIAPVTPTTQPTQLERFEARFPGMIDNIFERIVGIARVVRKGKYGVEIRTLLENIAIAGQLAGVTPTPPTDPLREVLAELYCEFKAVTSVHMPTAEWPDMKRRVEAALAAPGSTSGPTRSDQEIRAEFEHFMDEAWGGDASKFKVRDSLLTHTYAMPDVASAWSAFRYAVAWADGTLDGFVELGGDEVEGGATPQPTHCPLCGSSRRQTLRPNGGCFPDSHDPWHDGAAPLMEQSAERYKPVLSLTNKEQSPPKEEHVCKPSCHNPCLLD